MFRDMRVLITGITGLIGSHLADHLIQHSEIEVYGFKRWRSSEANIRHLRPRVEMVEGDIEDAFSVATALERARPDRVFHLAAQSYPSESWQAPATTLQANVLGTLNVLEAARRIVPEARIHIAGSAAAYGLIRPDEVPIGEDRPLWPVSPYGVSKAAQEMLGYQAVRSYGQQVYLTRSFIHIGPRQDARPAAQTFARQIAEAEAGLRPAVVDAGNLETRRDFLDVQDAVRGMWAVVERGQPGEAYNLCSGRAPSIRELLDIYIRLATIPLEVRIDPARLRPADEPILLGDNHKVREATGWQPEVPLEESAQRILDHWRTVVARDA
ncbi:MAG: GDP-mannose 4,6-dehydratase [uncultured Chloroflexia bacterium]|uniref:GDP-mannose 4,6-dehydratase n=1 Tax=uncultured Chloroflexia bacterium TaxID=1672391 RepID=A0A6J4I217_9CHLR|nr:MAG: GDP-mannose 4,6-dehydratase [uncultured Chloroflexia bacterium]